MVVEPHDKYLRRIEYRQLMHVVNSPGIGMYMDIYLPPDDVCFCNVETIEEECGANDSGIYQYIEDKGHHPSTVPTPYSMEVYSGLGTWSLWWDTVYSGIPIPQRYPPYSDSDPGSRIWDIPTGFRVVGTLEWVFLKQVRQQHTLAADKVTLTCSKGGDESPPISVYDPTSGF